MIVRPCLRHVLAALLVGAAGPAAALETRCVDTEGELDAAVRLAVDDDVEIHLVRGEYDIADTILTTFGFEEPEPDDDLAIIGGYAPGCGSRILSAMACSWKARSRTRTTLSATASG